MVKESFFISNNCMQAVYLSKIQSILCCCFFFVFIVVQAGFTQNRIDIEEDNETIDIMIFKQGLTTLTLMVNLTATYDNTGKNN